MFFFVLAWEGVSKSSNGTRVLGVAYLCALGLAHGLLHHVGICLLGPANSEVDSGAHLFNVDLRQASSSLLCPDQVATQVDHRLDLLILLLFHGKVHDVLQTLHIDLLNIGTLEEIQEHRFRKRVCILRRALECAAGERDQRLEANACLLILEL